MRDPRLAALHGGEHLINLALAQYASSNTWGIPDLPAYHGPLPAYLQPYTARARPLRPDQAGAYMFFLDDYKFESVWRRPHAALPRLQSLGRALTPDFTTYWDWPLAANVWNTYRSRWCGAWWHTHGIAVIPTVRWGPPWSYDLNFAGLPRGGLIATYAREPQGAPLIAALWAAGYREMVRRLAPDRVLVYGRLPAPLAALAPIQEYPHRWTNIRAARKQGRAVTEADRAAYPRAPNYRLAAP